VLVWTGSGMSTPPSAPERMPITYTPPHLAERILTSHSALEGERKQPPGGRVPLRDTPLPRACLYLQARPDAAGGLSVATDEHTAALPCAAGPGVGRVPRDGGDAARTAGASRYRGRPRRASHGILAAGRRVQHWAFSLVEAVAQLTRGLEVLHTLPDTPARARHELEMQLVLSRALLATKGVGAPERGHTLARARELCLQRKFPQTKGEKVSFVVTYELLLLKL
jgi:hypothetical protein